MWNRWRGTAKVALIVLAVLAVPEIYLRAAGFSSFPLYDTGGDIKYIPSANQSGKFMGRNAWYFNNRHMGNIADWAPGKHPNVLLAGNSIVLGGNPFDHKSKLGPQLEEKLGPPYTVWSVAAGGWTNVNELAYLDRNLDVLQNADTVIIEYMEGGLSAPAPWPGYYVFPDRKPWFLTGYFLRKYALAKIGKAVSQEFGSLPPSGADGAAQIERFAAFAKSTAKTRKLVIFLYPTVKNLKQKAAWEAAISPIEAICKAAGALCLDIAKAPGWSEKAYAADGVHLTAEGNTLLASILAKAVL